MTQSDVLQVLERQWSHARWPRRRALASIAILASMPADTMLLDAWQATPEQVRQLSMPPVAWKHVIGWLRLRNAALGLAAGEAKPWPAYVRSRGTPNQMRYSTTLAMVRGKAPAARPNQLLGLGWPAWLRCIPFSKAMQQ